MKDFVYVAIDLEATGARIRSLREANRITVEKLSEWLGVSANAVYKWQRGDALPTIDNMMVLSDIFNVKVEDIVVREDTMSSFAA